MFLVVYEHCILRKKNGIKFGIDKHTTKEKLEYIQDDLWGLAPVHSLGGNIYYLCMMDDFIRKLWTFVLRNMDYTFGKFKAWKILVENQTYMKVNVIRIDNELEFCNFKFDTLCEESGIRRQKQSYE